MYVHKTSVPDTVMITVILIHKNFANTVLQKEKLGKDIYGKLKETQISNAINANYLHRRVIGFLLSFQMQTNLFLKLNYCKHHTCLQLETNSYKILLKCQHGRTQNHNVSLNLCWTRIPKKCFRSTWNIQIWRTGCHYNFYYRCTSKVKVLQNVCGEAGWNCGWKINWQDTC